MEIFMNDAISFKYRFVAALLHGLGKIPIVSVAIFCILSLLEQGRNSDSYIDNHTKLHEILPFDFFLSVYGLFIGIPLIFAQPIVSLILWQLLKRWHPFIDLAGKIAVNRSVNALVSMTISVLLVMAIGTANSAGIGSSNLFITTAMAIVYAIALGYFIDAVIASIFALRGRVFRNRFIHDFLKIDR
jgi:uncharacterized Tic20 family protein